MPGLIELHKGMFVTPTRIIEGARVKHWKFAKECGDVRGGVMPGAQLEIIEASHLPGNMWIKVALPGRTPAAHLKTAGEEFASNFRRT